jgi:hypothetical protein
MHPEEELAACDVDVFGLVNILSPDAGMLSPERLF